MDAMTADRTPALPRDRRLPAPPGRGVPARRPPAVRGGAVRALRGQPDDGPPGRPAAGATSGCVVRRRGEGTFTAPRVVARLLGSPLSFTESMRRRGLRASSRMLHAGWIDPSPEDRAALRLPVGQPGHRRRAPASRRRPPDGHRAGRRPADAAPASSTTTWPVARSTTRSSGSGRIPTRAQARVSARPATDIERRLLGLDPDGVVLSERRTIDDQDGIPIEHTETLYAAERYEFEAVLQRGDHAEVS